MCLQWSKSFHISNSKLMLREFDLFRRTKGKPQWQHDVMSNDVMWCELNDVRIFSACGRNISSCDPTFSDGNEVCGITATCAHKCLCAHMSDGYWHLDIYAHTCQHTYTHIYTVQHMHSLYMIHISILAHSTHTDAHTQSSDQDKATFTWENPRAETSASERSNSALHAIHSVPLWDTEWYWISIWKWQGS